jgi:hypothetical protein
VKQGPWSNWVAFDEIGTAVSDVSAVERAPTEPKSPPIIPICDNVWAGSALSALLRLCEGLPSRAVAMESRVSLTRIVLWLLSLDIFDKAYAKAITDSSDEHTYSAPDLRHLFRTRSFALESMPAGYAQARN